MGGGGGGGDAFVGKSQQQQVVLSGLCLRISNVSGISIDVSQTSPLFDVGSLTHTSLWHAGP